MLPTLPSIGISSVIVSHSVQLQVQLHTTRCFPHRLTFMLECAGTHKCCKCLQYYRRQTAQDKSIPTKCRHCFYKKDMCNTQYVCEYVCVGVFEECSNCQVIRVQIQVCRAAGRPEQETDRQTLSGFSVARSPARHSHYKSTQVGTYRHWCGLHDQSFQRSPALMPWKWTN